MNNVWMFAGLSIGAYYLGGAVGPDGLPSPEILLVPSVVIFFLILINGLFVMAEFAIIGVRPSELEQMADEGNKAAENVLVTVRSADKQNDYIATAQVGITIASLGLGMYGEPQIAHFIEPYLAYYLGQSPDEAIIHTIGYLIAVGFLTYLHVVVGEMVPKSLALSAPARYVTTISGAMRVMQLLFLIPVRVLNGIGNLILRLLPGNLTAQTSRIHTTEELEQIVTESAEGGLLNEEEHEMIMNIFDFGDKYVSQVMTPRRKIEAITQEMDLAEILQVMADSSHSRFPVYRDDLDHIIGILHINDLVRHQMRNKPNFDLRLLMRPAPTVPEHYPVEHLLKAFRRQRIHMAIVMDEFGGTAGIVTLEDLLEEIVGEVRDEFDQENEPLVEIEPGKLELSGRYLLADIAHHVDLGPAETWPQVDTVGGLIVTNLGRPPKVGDKVPYQDILLRVIAVDGMAVARVGLEFEPLHSGHETEEHA